MAKFKEMKLETKDNIAIVFGLFETGLGVIRSLGRNGIEVIGVDYKKDIAWYSKYAKCEICPNPVQDKELFIQWAFERFKDYKYKIPIFITGDDFLKIISDEREKLSKIFSFNLVPKITLENISDKYFQYLLARKADIDVPDTWLIENNEDLNQLSNNKKWPLLIKGRDVNKWRKVFGGSVKGFIVNNFDELKEKTNRAIREKVPIILQEIIYGQDTDHYKYCAYIDSNNITKAEICLQKIRQTPIRFGVGAVVETIDNNELLTLGRKFFKNIEFTGVGSAEFKFDTKLGKFRLIELNARYWQQNAIGEAAGVNFPLINYKDLKGQEVDSKLKYTVGLKWVNRYMDLASFLQYRKEGSLTYGNWRKTLKGEKIYSDFSWDDPIPALYEFNFGLKLFNLPAFIWRKVINA